MSTKQVVIVGTGGSGRETYTLLRDLKLQSPNSLDFRGFLALDEPDIEILKRLGADFLGDPRDLVARMPDATNWHYSLGIGDPDHRRSMDHSLSTQGLQPISLIHPTVQTGPDVEVREGAVICANTVITTNVRIGKSAQINIGCVIAHDARIGDYVTLAQSVNIAGNVTIGDNATIFTGAIVLPAVKIGRGARVGAGSIVTQDVAPKTTVVGIPAKPLG